MVTVEEFYQTVPRFQRFADVTDATLYRPLPGDWVVGVSDVVDSTAAIRAGRYRDVNLAGACAIPAVANKLGSFRFPYVFGGDGVALALPGSDYELLCQALAETAAFVSDAVGLSLRTAVMTIGDIRAAGQDVRLARFARSPNIDYAMFAGGGVSLAVQRMKAGAISVMPAPAGAKPDLSGLSCRWHPMQSRQGVVLSMIVAPGAIVADFNAALGDLFRRLDRADHAGLSVSDGQLRLPWPWRGLMFEARAARRADESLISAAFRLVQAHLISFTLFRTGIRAGRFDPARYRRELVENADSAKFEDGLRMTIDCSPETAQAIEAMLSEAEARGAVRFGLHRQEAAIMTCLVPSADDADHAHFIDGASGGYAAAALAMKAKEAADNPGMS